MYPFSKIKLHFFKVLIIRIGQELTIMAGIGILWNQLFATVFGFSLGKFFKTGAKILVGP